MTQEEVATALRLQRTSVTQMEAGARAVSGIELERLAFLYGRDMRELVAPTFDNSDSLAVLFRAEPDALKTKEARATVQSCVALGRTLAELEQALEIPTSRPPLPSYDVPMPANKSEAIRQGSQVAGEERSRLDLGAAPVGEIVELLMQMGVHVTVANLPDGISGLTINGSAGGPLIAVRNAEDKVRQRFSFAHELTHVLLDRTRPGVVSRSANQDELIEVRANAFAAAFLLPQAGVRRFIESIGKGRPSRTALRVADESGAEVTSEGRTAPGSQDITLHDVVRLARHFGVSHTAALFRLRNLGFLNESELHELQESSRGESTRSFALMWRISDPCPHDPDSSIRRYVFSLGLEALRRDLITSRKLHEVSAMVQLSREDVDAMVKEAGLEEPPPVEARVPRKRG